MTETADRKSHYYLQLERRFRFLEDWRKMRRELAKGSEVPLVDSPTRRAKLGMLVGEGSGVPTRMIDARIIELAPGQATSTHRHLHDAVLFVCDGQGTTTIDGADHHWEAWDALHTPAWSWHRHQNRDRARPARLLAITDAPLIAALRLSRSEDIGDAAPSSEPDSQKPSSTASVYERELLQAHQAQGEQAAARKITHYRDVTLRVSPRGTRTALLVDSSLGFKTSGLSMAIFEMAPGKSQARHRHPGEAILYIVRGRGYTVIDERRYNWQAGDAVLVHHYAWHQHFNDDPDQPAVVIRMHMWESVIEIMQAALDPIPLYEDDPSVVP